MGLEPDRPAILGIGDIYLPSSGQSHANRDRGAIHRVLPWLFGDNRLIRREELAEHHRAYRFVLRTQHRNRSAYRLGAELHTLWNTAGADSLVSPPVRSGLQYPCDLETEKPRRTVSAIQYGPPNYNDQGDISRKRQTRPNSCGRSGVRRSVLGHFPPLCRRRTREEPFSEFYVLGPNGKATGYPNNLTVGENAQVILGIVNHEQRDVNYIVEVWLVNATITDNTTTVRHLFFIDEFSVSLNYIPANDGGNSTAEWQNPYNFSVALPGVYKIWFMLSLDNSPFQGVIYQDYAGTPLQDRFLSMVNNNYSLGLNLNVKA